jgi:hypothetical protein
MKTQIETDLRAALHDRASRVHASPDLLATDYHPRTRSMRPPLAIGSGLAAVVAVAAAAVATMLSLSGGASNAFAGWTSKPAVPSASRLASTEAYCSGKVPFQGLPLKIVDARGQFTIAVYSDGSSNDFCSTGPSWFTNTSGWRTSPPVTPPAGRLFLWSDHTSTHGGQSYGSMIARAGDGVSAATLTLDDGSQVTATVENGWAVAWWPGAGHVASARLTTPSGTQTQTFDYPCDVHRCNGGGPHGGKPDGGPGGG